MEKRLNFKVLGPLEVTSGDAQVPVGGPRHRTILVVLLLSPGRIVAVDTLIEAVWGDHPPATARTQVSICIAALRKTFKAAGFPGEIIVTAHPGYLLQVGMHRLDSEEFSGLVSAAELAVKDNRPAEAARCYADALELWRGRPLAGVTGRLVEDEARRLEALKLDTYENATAVHLQLGDHQKILPDLAAMVREHPLRERARHQLITAQYHSGRRAEALETFRDGRRWLIDELGLEPGPALSELHNAILQDEPSLAVRGPEGAGGDGPLLPKPVGDPLELPPDVQRLAGRKEELAQLDELLDLGAESRGPATGLITGVGGVGKTCLAVHWAHSVSERFPDGQLFADLRGYDVHLEPTTAGEILGRFLRSLSVPIGQIPSEPEERAALYRSLLADRRVLVVLDNVRTFAQVRPLLPSSGGCCVLVTSREQLSEMLAWPPRAWVRMGRLSPYEAVELLGRIVGEERIAADPPSAARLVELCDLLPLALRIAGARLASKPHWTVSRLVRRLSDERQRLDELSSGESQVRASFALTYRGLSAPTARLYRCLGLLDVPDFGAWVAAALLDTDLLTGERLIEQLVDAQFLDVVGLDSTGHPRYRFQNLLRLFARERAEAEETAEERRSAQERAFRAYLALAEQAHRRAYGGDFSIIHSPVPRHPLPEELAAGLLTAPLDWLETERLSLTAVVDRAAALGMDELAWDLTMSVVVLFETRNYLDDWRECSERALAATRAAGNARGQAAMLHNLGALEMRLRNFSKAYSSFSEALVLHEQAGEEHGRALVLRNVAMIDEMRGELDTAMDRSARALATFRAVGDLSSEAHVLNNMAQIELDRGHTDAAQQLSLESVRVSTAIGEGGSRSLALGTHRLARVYLAQGAYGLAEEAFLRMIPTVRAKSDMLGLAHGLLGLGEARLGARGWGQARRTLVQALEIAGLVDSALVEGRIKLALGEACRQCGEHALARQHFADARDDFARIGMEEWTERARLALSGADTAEETPEIP